MKQGTPGTYGSESLPNITGFVVGKINQTELGWGEGSSHSSGALYGYNTGSANTTYPSSSGTHNGWNQGVQIDASRSSSTYKDNAKVNPDNAEILYVIKF